MSAILIDQSLYSELGKIGIETPTLVKMNEDFQIRISSISPPAWTAMDISHANDVVRWTINASLGLVAMPQPFMVGPLYPPVKQTVDPGDPSPLETGPINPVDPAMDPAMLGGFKGVGPILSSPAARQLVVATSISASIRGEQHPAVSVIKALTGSIPMLQGPTNLLSSQPVQPKKAEKISLVPISVPRLLPGLFDSSRPAWESNPQLFKFPAGFPRTKQDIALVMQVGGLLDTFKYNTNKFGAQLGESIRAQSPGWALPQSDGVDWDNHDARFEFLHQCDQSMYRAGVESRELLNNYQFSLWPEASNFLAATKEFVYCDPSIFQDFWNAQQTQILNSGYAFVDQYLAQQQFVVNDLKTQLADYDFTKQEAQALTANAQKSQESTCGKIGDVVLTVAVAITVGLVVLVAAASGGRAHDPYPASGSYGPRDPNEPVYDPSTGH